MYSHNHQSTMDAEVKNFLKVWMTAITSMLYTYYVVSRLPTGITRLLFLLPIIYLFTTLPLHLSSVHLGGPTTFYLVWLGNFKLLLFAFDKPPLSSSLSLLHFISIALLPIKTEQKPSKNANPDHKTQKLPLYAVKAAFLGIIIRIYQSRQHLHPCIIQGLYCCHVYLGVELVLFITAIPVRAILGLEIEPQFNEPYLATSLQDFWGRRWNLMVSSILRPTVYHPVKGISRRILGHRWSTTLAIFATFLVSGLMHEAIYYYLTRVRPTWEVTWFFVLHGICTAVEVVVKQALGGRWAWNRVVSGPVTVGFVAATGVWLFLPQVIRNGVDQKAIGEYSILVSFFRDRVRFF